ncbi:hypothetical protein RF11_12321 [Thelohanellus kitauei]|uniref:Uncharacterized protein n=1 Tax=Thelohanellus kitauei TaxID=669202 RepID=A0A0C2MKP4_THEKT|nr:hypothetical protein RF11_12321 [Thelohanellus kitauei]
MCLTSNISCVTHRSFLNTRKTTHYIRMLLYRNHLSMPDLSEGLTFPTTKNYFRKQYSDVYVGNIQFSLDEPNKTRQNKIYIKIIFDVKASHETLNETFEFHDTEELFSGNPHTTKYGLNSSFGSIEITLEDVLNSLYQARSKRSSLFDNTFSTVLKVGHDDCFRLDIHSKLKILNNCRLK